MQSPVHSSHTGARRFRSGPIHPRATGAEGQIGRLLRAAAEPGETPACVVRRLTARIRAVARAHRLPAHDVEDVVQLTWLRLLEHGRDIREPAALGAWLHTTARRESLRVLHEAARLQPVADDALAEPVAAPGADDELEQREAAAVLARAIDALPARQRALMGALLADDGPSYAHIAHRLDMPIGSIGPTRARCMDRLRRDRRLASVAGHDDDR
jgi:RNA polymerase sigma factor (sigma-70 family)